jgi:transposase
MGRHADRIAAREVVMNVLSPCCAGLDVHKRQVVACLRNATGAAVRYETRTFGTTVAELLALHDWLAAAGCTHAVLESTGVYWKPVWHALEDSLTLVLANATAVRNLPGRKSDVSDAQWLADLVAHGLVRGSFVPPPPIQALRELTRTRKQLVREVTMHAQRIEKVLESGDVKLGAVLKPLLGTSGVAIVRALSTGETDVDRLVALAHPRLHAKRDALRTALPGRLRAHHRVLLREHLRVIAALQDTIRAVEEEIGAALAPFRAAVAHLVTAPGVATTAAQTVVAEIGIDMTRFPTAGHLLSWVGLCPRLDESAGHRRSTRLRKGAPWLKPVLIQCAWVAVRSDGYCRSQFLRLKARRGPMKAIVAVAASLLTAMYYMLRNDQDYRDLGADYFRRHDHTRLVTGLTRRLQHLGYQVTLSPAA